MNESKDLIEAAKDKIAKGESKPIVSICPTCGKPNRPMTNAERQRKFREKKRG